MEIFKLFGSIVIKDEDALKKLDSIDKKGDKTGKRFDDLTKKANKMAMKIGAAATAIGASFLALTGKAVDFESQMSNVGTLLDGDVSSKLKRLGDNVLEVSKKTGVSTDLMTDGLYQVISAFGDTADSVGILEVAAKSAKAGNATVTDSVNLLSAVTKGYGDTSLEANTKASDLAFTTVKLGQTTFPELASSMGKVIPIASGLGVKQEELFGIMATATGVTGTAGEVTTQFRGILQSLMSPTKDMSGLMRDLGYANGEAMIESLGMQGTIEAIVNAAEESGLPLQKYISSIEGQTLAMALAGEQSENLTQKTKAMYEATGATEKAFKQQTDNIKAGWDKVKNSFNVLLIKIGREFIPVLQQMIDMFNNNMPQIEAVVTTVFRAVGNSVKFVMDNMNWLVPVVGGLVGALLALNVINTVNKAMKLWKSTTFATTLAQKGLNAALLANPIGLVVAAIGALIAIGIALYMNWDTVKAKAQELWAKLGEVWDSCVEWCSNAWNNIITIMSEAWENLKSTVSEGLNNIVQWFTDGWNNIKSFCSETWETLKNIVSVGIQFLIQIISLGLQLIFLPWSFIWNNIKDFVIPIWDNIKSTIQTKFEEIKTNVNDSLEAIKNWFSEKFNQAKQIVIDIYTAIKDAIQSKLEEAKQVVSNALEAIRNWFNEKLNSAKEIATNIFNTIRDVMRDKINDAKEKVASGIENIKTAIGKVRDAVNNVKEIFQDIVNGIKDKMDDAKKKVSDAIEKIKSFFNFSWSLPPLKLPHLKASGKFSINPPSVPKFDIEWYKDGGIMMNPTMFGFNPMSGKSMVGGEAGPEAILPLSKIPELIKEMGYLNGMGENNPIVINIDGREVFRAMSPHMGRAVRSW